MEILLCIALLITAISKSAVCCCSLTRIWKRRTKSDCPRLYHYDCGCEAQRKFCISPGDVNSLFCFVLVNKLRCIALHITAISKSAVCCCSVTRMWRQKTKSDSSQTSSSNACRFIPNSLWFSSAYTLRCIALQTIAILKLVVYSSSRKQTSLRWTGATSLCALAISTHPLRCRSGRTALTLVVNSHFERRQHVAAYLCSMGAVA